MRLVRIRRRPWLDWAQVERRSEDTNSKAGVRECACTSSICSATGTLLENGGRYAITIKPKEASWYDRDIPTIPAGFYSLDAPSFWQKGLMVLAVPMRRELIRPWFRIVARTGGTGGRRASWIQIQRTTQSMKCSTQPVTANSSFSSTTPLLACRA